MKKTMLTAAALFLALGAFAGDGGKKGDKKCCKAACCEDPACVAKCKENGNKCDKDSKACKMEDVKKK